MTLPDDENRPSHELTAAFDGFQFNQKGYKVKEEEDQPPPAMGGSWSTRYTLENGVVVERLWDPVVQDKYIQFRVRLSSGDYRCFFKENKQRVQFCE